MSRPGRLAQALAALILALLLALAPAAAQQQEQPDFSGWESVAVGAERTLSQDGNGDATLEALRRDLVGWREQFLQAQSANQARIDTVRGQIQALGPAPAEGESEPEAIADRRAELNDRLAQLQAPRREAEEAYNRADGMIREIDETLRSRQTDALLELGPSPLNPVNWPDAAAALFGTAGAVAEELRDNWTDPGSRAELTRDVPVAVLFFAIALALLIRGRSWMVQLTQAMARRWQGHGRGVFVFLVSLGQVIVPVLGIALLTTGIEVLSILGPFGKIVVGTFFVLGLAVFVGRWLGLMMFPSDPSMTAVLEMPDPARAEARLYFGSLGLLLGLDILSRRLIEAGRESAAAAAVLEYPLILLSGVLLVRFGFLLGRAARRGDDDRDENVRFLDRVARGLGRLVMLVGVLGPTLAAIGYTNAGRSLIFPAVLSLALISLLVILYFLGRDLYALLRRVPTEDADQALIPVLATLILTLASLPLFALIWGARRTDIAEIWTRFREGFSIGETRISPGDFLTFLLVFAVGYALTRAVQGMLRGTVLPKTRMDAGGRNAVVAGLGYLGIFLAAIAAITSAGIDLSNLAIVAGALSVGIGFGLQTIVSNFVSGIILLIERPISQGDWIEVGGQMGIVKDISVRSTRIETFDRTDVIVPNADFVSGTVTNWTRGNVTGRVTLSVGVSYAADSRRVEAILHEICEAHPMVAVTPAPSVYFRSFGADALQFECFCILRDVNYKLTVQSELNHQVLERFREEGIEIPFAQRDLWLRNPEALHADRAAPAHPQDRPAVQGPVAPTPRNEVAAPDHWDDAPDSEGEPR
ncbi:MAG: DUF3772 domain-containing protein [Tranquillimonas sp.]